MSIFRKSYKTAISSEFLTHRVVQEYPMQRGKISISATFGGHLGFLRKMKKCEYLENRKRTISSELLTHRVVQECPMQRGKFQFSPLLAAILDFSGK